jgi:Na+/melibiose symporter-like transporter
VSGGFSEEQLRRATRRAKEQSEPHQQLQIARQQAEGYRNFLASLTGLLTAVFVLKGQENVSKLPETWRWTVVGLLAAGFVALIVASWLTVSAVHGRPGEQTVQVAHEILAAEVSAVRKIWRLVEWARWLALFGVLAVAAAVLITWIVPSA